MAGPGGTSGSQEGFALELALKTGLDINVIRAWILAENGPGFNYLGIRAPSGSGFMSFGSAKEAADYTANLLKTRPDYAPILKAKGAAATLNAIAFSPWQKGRVGPDPNYLTLLGKTYQRVTGILEALGGFHAGQSAEDLVSDVAGLGGWAFGWVGELVAKVMDWIAVSAAKALAYAALTLVAGGLFVLGLTYVSGSSPRGLAMLAASRGRSAGASGQTDEIPF